MGYTAGAAGLLFCHAMVVVCDGWVGGCNEFLHVLVGALQEARQVSQTGRVTCTLPLYLATRDSQQHFHTHSLVPSPSEFDAIEQRLVVSYLLI